MLAILKDPLASKIVSWVESIGLSLGVGESQAPSFMPGVSTQDGALWIDEDRLRYPGDILHEVGHLAVLPPSLRRQIRGDVGNDGGLEMAAIAWSYAAAIHLGVDPSVVFHEAGYRGDSESILENFAAGHYIGVPVLEWLGMTVGRKRAKDLGVQPYPFMLKWLRDE